MTDMSCGSSKVQRLLGLAGVAVLVPVFGVLWGATFLDEPVTLGAILGLITVLGSVALVTDLGRRRDAPLPPSSAPDESPAADGNSRDARA